MAASWKKILFDGDAVADNLATADLSQDESSRIYNLGGDTRRLSFKTGITQFVDSSNDVDFSFDIPQREFVVHNANAIAFREADDTHNIAVKAAENVSADYTITLPGSAPGGNNKILESDSSGNLSWISTPSGGGGGGSTTINNNADNLVITGSDTADTLEAEAKLTFNNSVLNVSGTNLAAGNGVSLFGGTYPSANAYISPVGANSVLYFGDTETGSIFDLRRNKLSFDNDSTNSYIQADSTTPENIQFVSDGHLQFYTSSSGTASLTLELDDSNQAHFQRDIILATNNRAIKQDDTGGTERTLIKCSSDDHVQLGDENITTEIIGTDIECKEVPISAGNATFDAIVATNSGLTSEGAHGEGSIVTFFDTGTTSVSAGRVYYYTGTAWAVFDSTTESKQTCLLGIALGTQEDDGFLLQGFVNIAEDTDFSAGKLCFVGAQARVTTTAPTSGFQRILGHAVTNDVMYFNPSQEYIDLS